jgi:hypothetical protein
MKIEYIKFIMNSDPQTRGQHILHIISKNEFRQKCFKMEYSMYACFATQKTFINE